MKFRIRDNSIRVRLTRSEVARLATGERLEQTTEFSPTAGLVSSVEFSPRVAVPTASLAGSRLSLLLPADQVKRWASSDQVSIVGEQSIAAGRSLQLLVEKDFESSHTRAEGSTDYFPNPRHQQPA